MKKISQEQIKKILKCELSTVSRYLTGKRAIKLSSALKVSEELKVPIEIFTDKETQVKFFGKSFLSENIQKPKQNEKV
ncbi:MULTISPECIES: helix-turn-helix domain-containing protein [Arcobacteraceae]|jgi:transcriptional regulator with XRE-family HTH domain|uniref:HTH cro/C1-type domain-containing protein n=1 Tax=Arcobacter lacus TaxID=1912876 RepID=A0ABX5JIY0_9BACT|nr:MULTISPECIES: helix-turn-helix transcriptional regulator [Arcobacteraceae]PUE66733.1 hypothetical protein B0175_05045 [Arcobacter lacus]